MENTLKKISAFIFDLDGVITDTSEFHYRAWQHLADDEGIPFSREENEKLRGVSRLESLKLILKGMELSEDAIQILMERKNKYYVEWLESITPKDVFPGVLLFLDELKASGIKSAIGSASKNTPMVLEKLEIGSYFDVVVDGLTIAKSKPAPDIFLKAAQNLGVLPIECVVVEDATVGIEAAQAAGMMTIGIGPVERVGKADIVLQDFCQVHLADILSILLKETLTG